MDYYDLLLAKKLGGGGGSDIDVVSLSVSANGVYSAPTGKAYDPVNVSVPTGVFPSGTLSITSNSIYDIASYASVDVNVSGLVPTGTSSITQNGIYDITNYASVDVNVSGGGEDLLAKNLDYTLSGSYTYGGTELKPYAFYTCSLLTSINCPSCTNIGYYAFTSCSSLTSVSFPVCTTVADNAFQSCYSLTTASFPSCKSIGASAFYNCSSLTTASFPSCKSIGASAFYNCSSLTTASFPSCTYIYGRAFQYCKSLESLFFGNTIPTLSTNTFYNTPISDSSYLGYFGSIFVPASLVNAYKTATNWATYSNRITSYVS